MMMQLLKIHLYVGSLLLPSLSLPWLLETNLSHLPAGQKGNTGLGMSKTQVLRLHTEQHVKQKNLERS